MVTPGELTDDFFRLLVESVSDYAIFALDSSGRVASWNAGAERIKGYRASEILGRHYSTFFPAEDIRRGKPEYALRVAADGGRWVDEGWRVRKDGSRFWASVVLTALRGPQGQLVGYAKVTRDLTERRDAEEERAQVLRLERSARAEAEILVSRLRLVQGVVEAALTHLDLDALLHALLVRVREALAVDTVAVLLLEGDELVTRAAVGLEEKAGRGTRIPLGQGFAGRVAAERRPIVLEGVAQANLLNPLLREQKIQALAGVPLIVEGQGLGVLHVGSLHDRRFTPADVELLQLVGDRVALAISHARLVEAERRAREEAAAAAAAVHVRDEFLSIAAHELKTPITALRAHVQLALRRMNRPDNADPERLRAALQAVDQQAGKLTRLVERLLDITRLEVGQLSLDPQPTDLASLVTDAVSRAQATTSNHTLVVDAPERVVASVDALRLEQVLTNLLDNAIKYSVDGGEIRVAIAPEAPGAVRLSVRDHGPGIPPERRARIFERFYQAHDSVPDASSGMGLGLFISHRIVELHGGTLRAEFPADGGTRFVVVLPVGAALPARATQDIEAA